MNYQILQIQQHEEELKFSMGKTIRRNDERTFDAKVLKQIKRVREIRKEQNSNKQIFVNSGNGNLGKRK